MKLHIKVLVTILFVFICISISSYVLAVENNGFEISITDASSTEDVKNSIYIDYLFGFKNDETKSGFKSNYLRIIVSKAKDTEVAGTLNIRGTMSFLDTDKTIATGEIKKEWNNETGAIHLSRTVESIEKVEYKEIDESKVLNMLTSKTIDEGVIAYEICDSNDPTTLENIRNLVSTLSSFKEATQQVKEKYGINYIIGIVPHTQIFIENAEKDEVVKDEAEKDEVVKDEAEKDEVVKDEAEKDEVVKDEAEKDEVVKDEAEKDEVIKDEVEKDEVKNNDVEEEKDNTPKTGTTDIIYYVIGIMIISGIGIITVKKIN